MDRKKERHKAWREKLQEMKGRNGEEKKRR
jgi:hypothetical protein